MYDITLKNLKGDPMKMWKSKWSQIFDTRCGIPYRYPKSPCQVSEKIIIWKVKISRHYTNQIAVGQALLLSKHSIGILEMDSEGIFRAPFFLFIKIRRRRILTYKRVL